MMRKRKRMAEYISEKTEGCRMPYDCINCVHKDDCLEYRDMEKIEDNDKEDLQNVGY